MKLQFPRGQIRRLAGRYCYSRSGLERAAADAASAMRAGDVKKSYLLTIVEWKSPRSIPLVTSNSDRKIKVAFARDFSSMGVQEAIRVLTRLNGIGIAIASAILALMFPERFTVMDFRSLEAVGHVSAYRSEALYEGYLRVCLELSRQTDQSLRELDKALWQWSWEKSERRKGKGCS